MKKQYTYALVAILALLLTASTFLSKQLMTPKAQPITIEEDLSNNNLKGQKSYEIDNDDLSMIDDSVKKISSPVSLTITNYQNTDENIRYTYELTIENISGAYKTTTGNESKYLVFDAKGKARINLNSNQHITIEDLPSGSKYTIKQNSVDSYQTTANNLNSNTYTATLIESNKIIFNNTTTHENLIKNEADSNPNTLDPIFILGITFVIAALASVILICKNKKTPRYEQDL